MPNSEYRILIGHERELITNLTLGLQYYLEGILNHGRLLDRFYIPTRYPNGLPGGIPKGAFTERDTAAALAAAEAVAAYAKANV